MYACNKCGAVVNNPNEACPNCGIVCTSNVVNVNEASNKFPVNIFVVIIAVLGILVSVAFMQSGFSTVLVSYEATNFSLEYDNLIWSAYDVNDELFALVDNIDTNTFIQMPYEAAVLGMNLNNEENLETLYLTYIGVLSSTTEMNYTNVASNFKKFEGTDYYYLTADFVGYTDTSTKGKLYVLVSPEGKALNILINLGSRSFDEVEEDVLEVLKTIKM